MFRRRPFSNQIKRKMASIHFTDLPDDMLKLVFERAGGASAAHAACTCKVLYDSWRRHEELRTACILERYDWIPKSSDVEKCMRDKSTFVTSEVKRRAALNDDLLNACLKSSPTRVRELLDAGANACAALQMACADSDPWIVQDLLEKIDSDAYALRCKNRALLSTSYLFARVDIVRDLLRAGADPRVDDGYALVGASFEGHVDVVRVLVQAGADLRIRNKALLCAAKRGHANVVRVLVQVGADLCVRDKALLIAVARGHVNVVRVLVKFDPRFRNSEGVLLYDASKRHVADVQALLQKFKRDSGRPDHV